MQLSIIIPAYNSEKTIKRCMDSVLNQNLRDFEVIVVNDGSIDKTEEILREYEKKDSRVSVITQANSGQGLARNHALECAKGKYVGFVDSDDEIEPDMYLDMLSKIGDAQVCQCNILDIYEDKSERIQLHFDDETVNVTDRKEYFDTYFFNLKHSYESCNKIFLYEFLKKNNIKFGNNREIYSEDFYFNIQIVKKIDKIVFVNKPYYHYYQIMTSHSKTAKIEDAVKAVNIFKYTYDENLKYEISRLATLFLMTITSVNYKQAQKVLIIPDVRVYLKNTLKTDKRFHVRFILFSILYFPMCIKKMMIHLYYGQKLAQLKEKIMSKLKKRG